ncbi:DHA2 family efflux MFS transporter permease subunit [Streptomyces sp. NPDC020719]|uniref:DHA2 family efflux MFS transporter permease subunit n=1 Tax=unclassified Streptomyces TaxID=2593676 RepID=UPI0033EBA86B
MRKWGPLVAVCLGTFMLLLDVTIVTVALPDMASSLDASLSSLQWVIDVYALALAALLLGAGAGADVAGRRKFYAAGTVLFALSSLACGLANSSGVLIAMRALQGVGAAAMFATTLPLLGAAYQGRDRSVALGVWGAVNGAAAALGPILGGLLTEGFGWRWIFFVNLPVSAAAVWLTIRVVPESRNPAGGRIDWAGTVLFALFAGSLTYGAVNAGTDGWGATRTLVSFAVSALALLVFVVAERRAARPLMDLSLLRRPAFVGVLVAALALNAAAFGVLPYTSIWLQTLLGMSPVTGGLALVPLALASFATSALGGRFLHGVSQRLLICLGLLLIGLGMFGQALLDADSDWKSLVAGLVVTGVGVGLVSPALASATLASVPQRSSGMAAGAMNSVRQLGYAVSIAVFGTLVTSRMTDSLHSAEQARALAGGAAGALRGRVPDEALHTAFATGLNWGAVAAGGLALVAALAVFALVRTPSAPPVQVRTNAPVPVERA